MEEIEIQRVWESLKKMAYRPILVKGNCPPRFSTQSKYNGYPYLQSPTDWPLCTICGNLMPLVFQLNLSEIPGMRKENVVIQYFECVNRDVAGSTCELGYPKINSSLVRKVKITTPPIQFPVDFSSLFSVQDSFSKVMLNKIFQEYKIVGWEPFDDYPSLVDFNEKMEYLTALVGEETLDFLWENLDLLVEIEDKQCCSDDKLFGYPHWSQTECYPKKMKEEMKLLFQINGFVASNRSSIAFRDGERGMFFQTDDLKDIVFTTG